MQVCVGDKLGPYEILALIGAGGMGEVWKAHDPRLNRTVAIKRLKGEHGERFAREARAIAALNHPHICQVYDVGPDYLVMEYIEGEPLGGPMALEDAALIAAQIAQALEASHSRGILHRDLKPGNVLITKAGAKLLDFGLAKTAHGGSNDETAQTIEGSILGTAAYMSPEQAQGKAVDERSDIFSFGAVLYEMLSGRRAFVGQSLAETLSAVMRDTPAPLDSPMSGIVSRCLAKSPSQRFTNMSDVRAALAKIALKPADQQPSIAVLPFATMSRDPDDEYFCDGLAEEIINALANVPGLKVIARTSAFAFKGRNEDIRRIAETLGVASVLEGSVRRGGNRLRITAQLIHAADGTHLWSKRYDREMTDIFAVQDEIAAAVVNALQDRLGTRAQQRVVQRQAVDIEAYHHYVKGLHYWHENHPDSADEARHLFEQALAVDPNYALPMAAVAQCHFLSIINGASSAHNSARLGIEAAEKALALDDSLGEALGTRAVFRAFYEYRWDQALKEFERGIELSPAASIAPHLYAIVLAALHRLPDALRSSERALKLDPFRAGNSYFTARVLAALGEYEHAIKHARRAVEIAPEHWAGYAAIGLIHLTAGHVAEALQALEKMPRTVSHYSTGWLGCAYVLAGQRENAARLLDELRETAARRYISPVPAAMICAQLGDSGAAFGHLETAVNERDFQLYGIQIDPAFNSLRADPRYQSLLRQMQLLT